MKRTLRTNIFVLILIINQIGLSLIWGDIVLKLSLSFPAQLILTQLLVFIVPTILFFIVTKEPVKITLSLKPLGLYSVLLIILISFFIQPMMSLLSAVMSMFVTNNVSTTMIEINNLPFTVVLTAMAVTPAICEEIFFRGITFSGYKNISLKKAALMTGFMFGLMHLDIQQFPYAFVMGVIFSYLVYYTKSIYASMLAHFVINGTQVLLSKFILTQSSEMGIEAASQVTVVADYIVLISSLVIISILTIPVLWLAFHLLKNINTHESDYGNISNEDVLDYSPIVGFEENAANIPFFIILILYIVIVVLPL